ncbi:hypothetical protein [Clostridium sp. AM58-1XD]|nr:hypothetical protein [Clostridium sp. AM58-1XD]
METAALDGVGKSAYAAAGQPDKSDENCGLKYQRRTYMENSIKAA